MTTKTCQFCRATPSVRGACPICTLDPRAIAAPTKAPRAPRATRAKAPAARRTPAPRRAPAPRPVAPASNASQPVITARFPGTCIGCAGRVLVGDRIIFDTRARSTMHVSCAAPAPAPVAAPVPVTPPAPAPVAPATWEDSKADLLGAAAISAKWEAERAEKAKRAAPACELGWSKLSTEERERMILTIRELTKAGSVNAATALIVRLADVETVRDRVLELTEIDARAARAGMISREDRRRRMVILDDACTELGFDPRDSNGPKRADVIAFARPAPALGSGELAPLVAGDWAELGRRVALGLLSEADAKGFGAIWIAMKGAK